MKNMKQLLIALMFTSAFATPALAAKLVPASSAPASPITPAVPVRTVVAAATVATPATPTPAAPLQPPSTRSIFYVGAQLGDSTIGAIGGYQINKIYAMEVSYDYVDTKYTPTTILENSRIGVSGLAVFPIKFSEMGPMALYVKVGYGRSTEKFTLNDPGLGTPAFPPTATVTTTFKTGVTGGAGVQVDLSNNTTARLGVNYVGGDRSVYLAALYKF